eukprot:427820-Prymnesium_polylepis.1
MPTSRGGGLSPSPHPPPGLRVAVARWGGACNGSVEAPPHSARRVCPHDHVEVEMGALGAVFACASAHGATQLPTTCEDRTHANVRDCVHKHAPRSKHTARSRTLSRTQLHLSHHRCKSHAVPNVHWAPCVSDSHAPLSVSWQQPPCCALRRLCARCALNRWQASPAEGEEAAPRAPWPARAVPAWRWACRGRAALAPKASHAATKMGEGGGHKLRRDRPTAGPSQNPPHGAASGQVGAARAHLRPRGRLGLSGRRLGCGGLRRRQPSLLR